MTATSAPLRPRSAAPAPAAYARTAGGVVVAAIDDDDNAGRILACAREHARRLRMPIRVVHVWTERGPTRAGFRMSPQDRIRHADRLLADAVRDHLPPDEAAAAERQILHDDDPARALRALGPSAAMLILAANSRPPSSPARLGRTAHELAKRPAYPLETFRGQGLIGAGGDRPVPVR